MPRILPAFALALALPFGAEAQQSSPVVRQETTATGPAETRRPAEQPDIPREMIPPAGKCRIWMEGVAPSQQPAPTDCQTALRQRPANGLVVFGPARRQPIVTGFGAGLEQQAKKDSTRRVAPRGSQVRPRGDSTATDRRARRRPRSEQTS